MHLTEAATSTIISVAGILGTVAVGSIGLYFTARSRTSPNRQALYAKQIELAVRIFRASGSARNLIVLLSPESEHQDYARDKLSELIPDLALLSYEAALLFPVELYVAFKRVSETLDNVITEYDAGRDFISQHEALTAADTRCALMARSLIGADELSIESLQLHSKKNALERLGSIEIGEELARLVRETNRPPKSSESGSPTQPN